MFILKFENFALYHVFITLGVFTTRAEALAAADAHRSAGENGRYHVFPL